MDAQPGRLLACLPVVRLLAAIAVALCVVPAPAPARAQGNAEPGALGERFEVRVVNVDVFVTDRKGSPVPGLERDDFEVYEDGVRVPISNFYVPASFATGAAADAPGPGAGGVPGRARAPAAEAEAVPESQRLHLIVFIDNYNIRPFDRNRVFRDLRQFLDQRLAPGDEVMLVTFERSLHVRHPFTADPRQIATALFDLEAETGYGLQADSERDEMLRVLEQAEQPVDVLGRLRQYALGRQQDVRTTINALKSFVEPLGGLPGRKAILHVSDGFEMIAAQDLFFALQEKFNEDAVLTEAFAFDSSRELGELTRAASANRVAFYTIDASGLKTYSYGDADRRGAASQRLSPMIDQIRFSNLQSPLQFMADETGGLAILNTNEFGPGLERVASDLGSFYSLGYNPPSSHDERWHRIKVVVNGKGLIVRHREGYRGKGPQTLMAEATHAALLFDQAENPGGIAVEVGAQQPRDDGNWLVSIVVRFPLAEVVLAPAGGFYTGRQRLFLSAMDEEGSMSPIQQAEIPVQIPGDELEVARASSFAYESQLVMRPGRHKVAIGLRDELAGTQSFVNAFFAVGGDG